MFAVLCEDGTSGLLLAAAFFGNDGVGVVGDHVVGLFFLLSFSGSGSFLLSGSSSSVGSDLGFQSADEVLERVELSAADGHAVGPLVDLPVVPAQMPASLSVGVLFGSGGVVVLAFHLGDLEGHLSLVFGDGSLSGVFLLSDFGTEESESLLTLSETLLGLLELLGEGVALVGKGDQIVGLHLDLRVLVVLDVLGLLHTDLSLDSVDGHDLVLDLLFLDVDLVLDLVDQLSLVADLHLMLVQLVLFGANLRLDVVELVTQTNHIGVVALIGVLVVAQLVSDLDAGVDRADQVAVDGLDLGLVAADNLLVLVQLGIQSGNQVSMSSALDNGMLLLVSGIVLLVSGHSDLVALVVNLSPQLLDSSEVSSDGKLVSSSGINQTVESVLESSSGMSASMGDMAPVSKSSLVVADRGSETLDSDVNSVDSNSVSLQRNSESSDVSLMRVELVLDGSARVFFSVTEFNLMLVLGSQPLDHVGFGSDQSLVVSDLMNVDLNLSVVDSDLVAQMVDIVPESGDHFLVGADFLIVILALKLSFGSSYREIGRAHV